MPSQIRWILFDAVGTLIYAVPPVAQAYFDAGRRFGSRMERDEIERRFCRAFAENQTPGAPTSDDAERERWRRIVASVVADVGPDQDGLFHELWRHFAEPDHWRLYDDAAAVLVELRRRNFRLGIASNFDSRLRGIVAGNPPLAALDAVVVSTDVGYSKPDPRFFEAIERRLDSPSNSMLLVGDDPQQDVQGATAAGWRAVQLDRSGGQAAPNAIQSLSELLELDL